MAIALKVFTRNPADFLNCFLYPWELEGKKSQSLLNFIQQDPERSKVFFNCLVNQSLDVFNRIPLANLHRYVGKNKQFQNILLGLLDVQNQTYGTWASDSMPVHIVAITGNDHLLKILIKSGANLNKPDQYGATPVFIAAQHGHVPILHLLKEFGADLNSVTKSGATPAYIAAQNGDVFVLRTLKKLGVDLNQPNNNGATPAYIAAEKGDVA